MARASPQHARRFALLLGSAINQDGRSSGLTVRSPLPPLHGPPQHAASHLFPPLLQRDSVNKWCA
jgi:hypothetical protein